MVDNTTVSFATQSPQDEEIWKPVVGFEDFYEVSNFGHVKRIDTQHISRPGTTKKGYKFVGLTKNNVTIVRRIHCLVMAAFVGARPKGMVINHLDSNPSNNHVRNLEYTTPKGNSHHSLLQGRAGIYKITQEEMAQVIRLLEQRRPHLSYQQIAEITGLTRNIVSAVGSGKRVLSKLLGYNGSTDKRKDGVRVKKLNADDIAEIKLLLSTNRMLQKDIAARFDVTPGAISRIKNNSYEQRLRGKKKNQPAARQLSKGGD